MNMKREPVIDMSTIVFLGLSQPDGAHSAEFLDSYMIIVVVDALLFYVHGKHLRSCRDGQLA